MRVHHEDGGVAGGLECLDGRSTRVTAGGAHDGGSGVALGQRPVHQTGEKLHRHILEGQRRPMEEFEQPLIVIELLQRRHGRVAEAGIGLGDHVLQFCFGNGAADEGVHDLIGDGLVALALQVGDGAGRKFGPLSRHVEPAIAGEPGEQHVFKTEFRSLAPGRNIAQGRVLSRISGTFSPRHAGLQAVDSLTVSAAAADHRCRSPQRRSAWPPARTR